jgi:hypothetical protein
MFLTNLASHGNAVNAFQGQVPGTVLVGGNDGFIGNTTNSDGSVSVANNNGSILFYWLGSDN